ncbi:hypothetical protein Sjap_009106 [Stephania japonica]|uniref:Disease resistance protein RGA3 n=1 Tax=Stephania japonica TaxID=461633 RepID=A0AAP0JT72_9MAGN
MGEDLIVHGAEEIVSRLISFAFDEIGLLVGVKRDAQSLQASLNSIHATLQDAEEKQVKEKPIRVWLEELKQVAYDVEDVFDEIAYEQLRRSILINNKGCYYYISSSFITRFALRFQFAHRIKHINQRLADIDSRKRRFNLQPTDDQNNPAAAAAAAGIDRETTSFVDDSDVVGREDDKENIVRMLINQHITSVVGIYGLGGLGKTTLAQLAYNDDAVLNHFHSRFWICVSDHFDTTSLFTQILEQIPDTTKPQSSTKQVLENALKEQLKGKKFLLVLDDVWTEQQEKWEDFAPPLKKFGAAGSKIIVTCRSQNVVMTVAGADQDSRYELKGLSKDDCWTLIQQRAFRPGGLTWNPEQIGKEISNKCKGVPLAAKMLGSLLQAKKEEWEWLAVQNAEIWNLPNLDVGENRIMEVLKLSYDDLSPALKSCFSYCAIFPKDYWISRELLIKLWMAQGLLGTTSSTIEESDMEDKGKAYFNRLYSKSFFQEAKMDKFGEVSRCKMHDHVQDLAQFICEYECQIMGENNKNSVDLSKCRHASLISQTLVETLKVAKKVRTIICFEGTLLMTRASTFFNFTLLRVLDLSHSECCNFPFSSHCKLKHLRYLDLSYTNIKSLPSWVTWLYNLQTLKLIKCGKLTELPEDLMNLKKLRHLHIDEYRKWKKMPQAIGELHQLQTLPIFVACEEYAGRGITALKNLNNLGGTLDIHCLCRVKEASLAKGANILSEKRNLRELRLHWDRPSSVGDEGDDSLVLEERPSVGDEGVSEERSCIGGGDGDDIPVLEVLRPHTNLQRLSIKGFGGVKFPGWVSSGSDLPNLVKMKLNNCNHCEHIPSFGGLHRLKKLELRSMAKLKEWLEGDGVMFPCLEELSIEDCPNLIKTTEHLFPSLKSLALENVGGMGVVSITSSLTSLTSLTITKCKDLEYLQEGLLSNNSQLNVVLISNCPILKAFEEEASTADEILPNRFLCELVIDESGISYARKGILRISKCPNLESIGKGFLSSLVFLESFQVDGRFQVVNLNVSSFHELEVSPTCELHIDGCP